MWWQGTSLCLTEQDPKSLSAVYYNITSFMLY
jgi:hypothetical protein